MSDIRNNLKRVNINVFTDSSKPPGIEKGKECLIHKSSGHSTEECRLYVGMDINDRYVLLKDNTACFSCLSPGHMINDCPKRSPCSNSCNKFHHSSLHNEQIYGSSLTVMDEIYRDTVIPLIMKVVEDSKKHPYLKLLWYRGSSVSFQWRIQARDLGIYP